MFVLLPESVHTNPWMEENIFIYNVSELQTLIRLLEELLEHISVENYSGLYDNKNLKGFLRDLDVLDDTYPFLAKRLITRLFQNFGDWNTKSVQVKDVAHYSIFKQTTNDNSFCEIAQRSIQNVFDKHLLINLLAHKLGVNISITVGKTICEIESVSSKQALVDWFSRNRIPKRCFQVVPKHGELRVEQRVIAGRVTSPLKCSSGEAEILLSTAFGFSQKQLYNFDKKNNGYVIFNFEGDNPQHMYHAYSVNVDSSEVPISIKARIAAFYSTI